MSVPARITHHDRLLAADTIERVAGEIARRPVPSDSHLARWLRNLRAEKVIESVRQDEWMLAAAYSDLVLGTRLGRALGAIERAGQRARVDASVFTHQLYRREDRDMPYGHAELHIAAELLAVHPDNHVEVLGIGSEGCDVTLRSPTGGLHIEVKSRSFIKGWETNAVDLAGWMERRATTAAGTFKEEHDRTRVVALDIVCHRATGEQALEKLGPELAQHLRKLEFCKVEGVLVTTAQIEPGFASAGYGYLAKFFAVADWGGDDPRWCGMGKIVGGA